MGQFSQFDKMTPRAMSSQPLVLVGVPCSPSTFYSGFGNSASVGSGYFRCQFCFNEVIVMHIGMLWFDNDPKADLDTKIQRAVAYYITKYGRAPTLCYVHPSMLSDGNAGKSNGIEVRATPKVLPNHFWMGIDEETKTEQAELAI